jgi:3-oxoacyl-[acyl-carrier-protein] synthase-3
MASFSVSGVGIAGIAAAVPKNKALNKDYNWISVAEREKLIKVVGISERRIAKKGVTSVDICEAAANKLLEDLEWDRSSVDLLVFVSQFRDYIVPFSAAILQDRLSLSTQCLAFDIPLGCSGYAYGLSVVSSMLGRPGLNRALLIVGDVTSHSVSYQDKSLYPLTGDAGTATALESDANAEPMAFNLNTDGSGYDMITIPDGGTRNPVNKNSFTKKRVSKGIWRSNTDVAMKGEELFEFALREVAPNIRTLLKSIGLKPDAIDNFVFHQANRLMIEIIRKTLKIPEERVPYSLGLFGNTNTATIPLTIVTELSNQLKEGPQRLLLSGFGIGLSWGAVVLKLENIMIPPLIEI